MFILFFLPLQKNNKKNIMIMKYYKCIVALFACFSLIFNAIAQVPATDSIPSSSGNLSCVNFETFYSSDVVIKTFDDYFVIDVCPSVDSIMHRTIIDTDGAHEFCELHLGFFKSLYTQYLMDVGYPSLPFYSLNLQLPDGAVVTNIRAISMDSCNSPCLSLEDFDESYDSFLPADYETKEYLNYPYVPFQNLLLPPLHSYVIDFQNDYYLGGDTSWNGQHYIFNYEEVEYYKTHGITLNIFPYQFIPINNELRVLRPTRFYIEFLCMDVSAECSMQQTIERTIYDGNPIIADFYDFYPPGEKNLAHQLENPGDYLIITEDEYNHSTILDYFINHKESLGYNVSVYSFSSNYTDSYLRSLDIRNVISQKYIDLSDLKNVLIIGSLSALPPSDGIVLNMLNYAGTEQNFEVQALSPPSDIYYECFDAPDDKHLYPKVAVGRWIINSLEELENIVLKTINEELSTNEFRLALFSGSDSASTYMESSFRHFCENLDDIFSQTGAMVHYYDGSGIYNSNPNLITDVLAAHNFWMTIYCGHGAVRFIGQPFRLFVEDLDQYCPFGFGFACLTNSFHNLAFGANALTYDNINGFCVYYGSSTYSYNNPNKELGKSIFKKLKQAYPNNLTISQLIQLGEQKYYQGHRSNGNVQRQLKRYNIFGDPSLHLFGTGGELYEPQGYISNPERISQNHNNYKNGRIRSGQRQVLDLLGRKISIGPDNTLGLPEGVYLIYDETSLRAKKIFISNR